MQKDNQSASNNTLYNETKKYKNCAGLRCFNKGKKLLKIIYIEKSGWFCDDCY